MIKETSGNLLRADADALVNTVNTEGVMGKGIALQFKKAYPAMFDAYRLAAKAGQIRLGHIQVWPTNHLTGPKYVINFPTKGHWKSRSKLKDIEEGLADLVRQVRELEIRSIALPPLGCGNGGLEWRDVKPVIMAAFDQVPDVDVLLYPPAGAPSAAELVTATARPRMTPGRAALVATVNRYTEQALAAPGPVESQKLMYFLQVAGEPLRLNFVENRYGPYADNLRHVLSLIEGHFLSGYGDGSAAVSESEPLTLLPGAAEEAQEELNRSEDTRLRIERVLELAVGFESAYGLELLATVHWIALHNGARGAHDVAQQVSAWSPRKARMFTTGHVETALNALSERGWITQPSAA